LRTRATVVIALVVLGVLCLAPAAGAAPVQRTSLSEVSAEVMCPVCGTLLELAESPQALREKAFVTRLVEAGKTKDQIKDALVAEYGDAVLALPQGSGFSLSAYLVPVIAFAIAAVALCLGVLRWRRAGGDKDDERPAAEGPSAEDDERLDADLARYDL
jgi:cytochrome c-type biogenesis protein CcmH/NrfF